MYCILSVCHSCLSHVWFSGWKDALRKKAGMQTFETLLGDEAEQKDQPAGGNRAKQLNSVTESVKILILQTVQPMSSTVVQQVRSRKPVKARASSWQQYGLVLASGKYRNTPSVWSSPLSQHGHVTIYFRYNPAFLKAQLAAWYEESFQNKAILFPLSWLPVSTGSVQRVQPAQPHQHAQGAGEGLCYTTDSALIRDTLHLPGTGMPSPMGWGFTPYHTYSLEYQSSRQKGGRQPLPSNYHSD